jgi:hypothetical protein
MACSIRQYHFGSSEAAEWGSIRKGDQSMSTAHLSASATVRRNSSGQTTVVSNSGCVPAGSLS